MGSGVGVGQEVGQDRACFSELSALYHTEIFLSTIADNVLIVKAKGIPVLLSY